MQVEYVADDEVDVSDMEVSSAHTQITHRAVNSQCNAFQDMEDLTTDDEEVETQPKTVAKRKRLEIEYENEPTTSKAKRERMKL